MTQKLALSSSELGTLWLTYQQKTMTQRMLEYFIAQADDNRAKEIMQDTHMKIINYIEEIKSILKNEGAVIPVGYTEKDVNIGVPKLYDNMFDIMFLRLLKEISMGLHTLHLSMLIAKISFFFIRNYLYLLKVFMMNAWTICKRKMFYHVLLLYLCQRLWSLQLIPII